MLRAVQCRRRRHDGRSSSSCAEDSAVRLLDTVQHVTTVFDFGRREALEGGGLQVALVHCTPDVQPSDRLIYTTTPPSLLGVAAAAAAAARGSH